MAQTRLIKRYANRKLYDTTRSSYVTLDEIAEMIGEGDEIRIIDNRSKEDLTAVTMAQILVEQEKRQKRSGPLTHLRDLIQQSGDLFQRTTRVVTEPVTQVRTTIEGSVGRLIRSGEERAEETREQLRGWFEHQTQIVDDMQAAIDERVKVVTNGLTAIARLQQELSSIRLRLDRLEAHLGLAPLAPVEVEAAGDEADPTD